jgi:signal recognition particle subunit SRP54
MKKMGGLQGIMGMLPGVAKMKAQMAQTGVDDRMIARQEAIISSMTKAERKKPDLLNASRRKRIAAGAGVEVQEINRLLKQHRQMADMVKSLSKGGPKKMQQMAAMMGGLGGGMGGGPDMARLKALGSGKAVEPSSDELKAIQDRLAGLGGGQLPNSFPGGLPGLPGFPPKKN